jgi:hypothetical protein
MAATTRLGTSLVRAGLVLVILASGCRDGPGRDDPNVGIYAAAIQWLVDDRHGNAGVASGPESVYVEAIGDERISLEVQAGVVERLEDVAKVRFIDAREEAIDISAPGDPVRREGLLVGLGPVRPGEGSGVLLYAHRYADADDVVAYELVLERAEGRWQVAGRPEPVSLRNRARTAPG